jgi:hypothetical protein
MGRHLHGRRDQSVAGRIFFGVTVLIIGVLLLLKGVYPELFTYSFSLWPVILMIVGLGIGIKSRFRNAASWILLAVGGYYFMTSIGILGDYIPKRIVWPSILIILGLLIIVKKKGSGRRFADCQPMFTNGSDTLDIDISFAGRKEIVTSKNFQGGVIRASFAGAEINLVGADSQTQPMVLELHANFAGIELIVPSHWTVQNEINPTMGSVEDLRMIRTADTAEVAKTLILRGSCSFGSVELKSY